MKPEYATHLRGLYIVTPDWDDTAQLLAATELALQNGAALVQYRHKTAGAEQRRAQASALLALCRRYDVPLIINDHVDLCLEIDADGIHVGGTDASIAEVRKAVGPDRIVGASCYGTLELAHAAYRDGASYVAFGGFYPSRVKKYDFRTAPEIIAQSKREIPLPVVVIGGITLENAPPLVAQGADMVAVISSVYLVPVEERKTRQLADLYR
ncbi:thiamine phosphate synthase [Herbaspirillum sp.]|jgi:thiamine-phosphate pyrophosphorylase|uniref:thiamine phosphate synthase n=1 Tax=Herbaspirillum TaxID=963 RepID=UPI00258A0902|nr:thiamine phosphate synthase [Herbaspirillum sp.]MCP3654657.1 thiamine phosphate synthase [Herbaspirillum sp.]MCP3948741.1 thiamine phosphate synthase [Herbaspirillum sp.]MCP4033320.1 thiamine phosphate synthase [Herbaspirillum sp.]MCP4556271.1 thiamine phosphate synthase [Herbaspirillum sp.]